MKITLKAYLPISNEHYTHIGDITLKNSELVKFKRTENYEIVEQFSNKIFPIKRSEFEIHFLDEFDDEIKIFNAFIKIKDSLKVGVKLNYFQEVKLKLMLKKYLIQSKEIKIELLKYLLITIISFIGGAFYERHNSTIKIPKTTPNIEPNAVDSNSLQKIRSKKPFKKDSIIVK